MAHIQMRTNANRDKKKKEAAAIAIQKHARRLSAMKIVEKKRTESATSDDIKIELTEEEIEERRKKQKEAVHREEITHTIDSCLKQLWKAFKYFFAFSSLIIVGGLIFSAIEYEQNQDDIVAARKGLEELKAYFNNNETIIKYLEENAQYIGANDLKNHWVVSDAIFYAFTIATTIGYGVFSPATVGGQVFTIFYALLAIPIGTSCIVAIAEMAVHGFTVLYSMTLNRLDTAFDNLDTDGGGFLDHEELKQGLIALNVKINDEEFQHVLKVIDEDGDQQIDRNEFKTAVHLLHADLSEVSARGAELKILLITLFVWLGLGTIVFMVIEKWNFVEAVYFTMVTLTTIGLGDFAPVEIGGKIILYIFTFVGIGLVATLIHVVGDMAKKAEHEAHIRMEEARVKMLHHKKKTNEQKDIDLDPEKGESTI